MNEINKEKSFSTPEKKSKTLIPYAMLCELTHRCPLSCPYCSNPVELELKSKFDQKQKKLLGELNDELEAEKLKNSLLEEKSKRNKELLKEKIKTELSAEFSAKELSYQKNQI